MIRSRRCPLNFSFLICLIVALTGACRAEAVNLTFQASIEGTQKNATEETVTVQGVTYVSLRLLTEKFGGAYNIQQTNTKVDLAGATAWVESNNDEVSAAFTTFSLTYPILHRNGDVLIAAVDVPLFFQKGFGVAVTQQARTQTSAPTGIESKTILRRPIRVIVIDAGHGGRYEPGVEGPRGLLEKDLTLAVALQLQKILSASVSPDLKVVLTRKEAPDSGLSLRQRAALSKDARGDLLISIHCGGSFSPTASGLTLYYPPPRPANEPRSLLIPYDISKQSEEISASIANSLIRTTSAKISRMQAAPCALLKASGIPGLLIEVGHLTNPTEEALLGTRSYQQQIAQGIATGLLSYLDRHSNPRKPVAANNRPTWNAPSPTTGKILPTLE